MKNYICYDVLTGKIKYGLTDSDTFGNNRQDILENINNVSLNTHYVNLNTLQIEAMSPCPSTYHTFNYSTHLWEDLRSIEQVRLSKWEEIKKVRTNIEYGGFDWDGSTFDSDPTSVQRISGSVLLAQLNPSYTVDWTLADNTVRTLSAADLLQVAMSLGSHVQSCFVHGQALRDLINNATTIAEVEAITWSTNV